MPETSTHIYTVGGTVQAGEGVYIPRLVDDELLELCQEGTFAYILSPRQSGKSSLMIQTARQLEADGVCTATLDLTLIGTQSTHEEWYYGVVEEIHRRLQLRTRLDPWWDGHEGIGATQRLVRYFEEVVLAEIPGRIVIFVDEIDTTLNLTFTDDFFIAIRGMYEARAATPAFKRLSFVLIGVATPGDLIRDPERTPFNIGWRVDMPDFTLEEALPLAAGLRLPGGEAERVLGWVLKWTGGHPYLTQRLCLAFAQKGSQAWTARSVESVVADTFFGLHSGRDNNLQFVRNMLTTRALNRMAVLKTYLAIWRGRQVLDEEQSLVKSHLKLAGVVRRESKDLRVRNRIYKTVFDGTWVKEHLPRVGRWAFLASPIVRAGALVVLVFLVILANVTLWTLNRANEAESQGRAVRIQASLGLAANAENQLDVDPELSILLAMNAISSTYSAGEPVVPQAQDALHHALLRSALRHTFDSGDVQQSVAWSPDGHLIAAGGMILDATAEMEPMLLSGTYGIVRNLAWSPDGRPDGRKLLTISEHIEKDGRTRSIIQIWEVAIDHGQIIGTLIGVLSEHLYSVNIAIWSPDGSSIATTSLYKTANIWDAVSMTQRGETMNVGRVSSAAWSPNGARLVTASDDNFASIWEVKSGRLLGTLTGHAKAIGSVDWSSDGLYIATASNDGTMKIWDANNESELQTPNAGVDYVNHVAWSPYGWDIVTVSNDGTVTRWSLDMNRKLRFVSDLAQADDAVPLRRATWSPDGRSILGVTGGREYLEAYVWDVSTGELRVSTERSKGINVNVKAISWSPSSEEIVTANGDGTVRIWAIEQHELPIMRIDEDSTPVLSPDGKQVAIIGKDKRVGILDAMNGQLRRTLDDRVERIAWSPDGQRLITASSVVTTSNEATFENTLKLWDAGTGRLQDTFRADTKPLIMLAWSPDDKHIASVSADGSVLVWDLANGQTHDTSIKVPVTEQLSTEQLSIEDQSVSWSPDGRWLVLGEPSGAKVWNVADRRVQATLDFSTWSGPSAPITSTTKIVWSPDGLSLISVNRSQGTVVWDTKWDKRATPEPGRTAPGFTWLGIEVAAWSPDGRSVATAERRERDGAEVGVIRVWDAQNWALQKVLTDTAKVDTIVWRPDSRQIASMNRKGIIRIRDVASWRTPITLQGSPGSKLVWSQDGLTLSALSSQGLYHYILTIPELLELAQSRVTRELTTEERGTYFGELLPAP